MTTTAIDTSTTDDDGTSATG
ncbi:uncharacterized protein G2W53_040869 [Senna tora]|uniref:Uncharacterized protein n=1 Tax=Senna tora TaxID=362788 RepID=A0A834SDY8_9FABA|nr:uncharacterized protein G2W53_040869 [Senna tora]